MPGTLISIDHTKLLLEQHGNDLPTAFRLTILKWHTIQTQLARGEISLAQALEQTTLKSAFCWLVNLDGDCGPCPLAQADGPCFDKSWHKALVQWQNRYIFASKQNPFPPEELPLLEKAINETPKTRIARLHELWQEHYPNQEMWPESNLYTPP
jgi:hypothetical protein